MTYFLTHDQAPFPFGITKNSINEPSVGTAGSVVFISSNVDAAFSTDGGNTFAFVDPFGQFPTLDGGFCCDQTVMYDHNTKTMMWSLLYYYSTATQKGSFRIAAAPAANVASSGWCYYDFNPQFFGLGSQLWLDYPDVAISNNYVWYTANIFNANGVFQSSVVWRMLIGDLSTCSEVQVNYLVTDHFALNLAQGATSTMYWFSHNSTSSERIYNWPETSSVISWNDVGVTTFYAGTPSCPGPDGVNWCGRSDTGHGRTAWVAGGVVGTMWNSAAGGGHPYPYVRVARFNQSNFALINEPDIWNAGYAFIYPAIGVDDRGHIAGVLFYGGGSLYASMATMIWDDFSSAPPPWELYGVVASSSDSALWGDFYSSRRHGTDGNTWVGTGEYQKANGTVDTYYLWFGRQRDTPPSLVVTPGTYMAFTGPEGGPFLPTSFQYQLSASANSANYQITGLPFWLNANFTSGTATTSPVADTFSLFNVSSLAPGSYSGTIAFNNTDSGIGNTTRTATLTVTGSMSATPNSGGAPLSVGFQTLVAQTDNNTYTINFGDGAISGPMSTRPTGVRLYGQRPLLCGGRSNVAHLHVPGHLHGDAPQLRPNGRRNCDDRGQQLRA